jgi:hypothetical protein
VGKLQEVWWEEGAKGGKYNQRTSYACMKIK